MPKNITKFLGLLLVALIWLPTGVSDIWVIPFIIEKIGLTMYVIISIVMVIWLYKTIEGNTLRAKINNIKRETRKLIR